MKALLDYLILPPEISAFERRYLQRVNRIGLSFFALHIPVLVLIAWANGTGPALAAALMSAVLLGPLLAFKLLENPRTVSVILGMAAMFAGGLLVHFGQGPLQIEMHFYFFALLAMCSVFSNPLVVVAAAVTVALHHLIVWMVLPHSVFNYDAAWWVVGVHAAFVVLVSTASCFIARSFFDSVIGLEKIVEARTRALDGKNKDMRLLLDNMEQGFLTIDRSGILAPERSAAVDRWFGAAAEDATWVACLKAVSPDFAERTRLAWAEVADDFMPFEITLDQMPHRLTLADTHLNIDYRAIGDSESPQRFLIVVTDVTTEVARERAEIIARESMAVFECLLSDRAGFDAFFEEATSMVDLLVSRTSTDASLVKRVIHTLKGNSALYGLLSVAGICHKIEDAVAESNELPTAMQYAPLVTRWKELVEGVEALVGERAGSIEIDDAEHAALEAAVRSGEPTNLLLKRVQELRFEPMSKRLDHFASQARRIAERLDKRDLIVKIDDGGVRLDSRHWTGFWSAFIHAVRNALDHGIESPEERIKAGKPGAGTFSLRTASSRGSIVIEIADDGRGIDWVAIAAKARSRGLPASTSADLQRALFVDGVTTAEVVSDLSGRGVGMGALLQGIKALGGNLVIDTALGKGTTLRMTFPQSPARSRDELAPAA